jgi:GNAT superfamily N-acetyltransferase
MKCIRRSTTQDSDIINLLRINEFRRSTEFNLLLADQLKWSRCDESHIVLAAWADRHRAVSTMRAVVVNNAKEALDCVQCSLPDRLEFPAIVFNSAATHAEYRRQGLNQALRYYFLRIAIRCRIKAILSPIYRGAPRIDFMKALGYRFLTPEKSWQTKLAPKKERILGILPLKRMGRAIDYLRTQRSEVLQSYPWVGPPFEFPLEKAAGMPIEENLSAPASGKAGEGISLRKPYAAPDGSAEALVPTTRVGGAI